MTTKKLPKAFKKKWVDALKSGKYTQGKGYLKLDNEYCCLGVAAEISGLKTISGACLLSTGQGVHGLSKIPAIIRGKPFKGDKRYNPVVEGLVDMNDGDVPFEVIAGVINEYL